MKAKIEKKKSVATVTINGTDNLPVSIWNYIVRHSDMSWAEDENLTLIATIPTNLWENEVGVLDSLIAQLRAWAEEVIIDGEVLK